MSTVSSQVREGTGPLSPFDVVMRGSQIGYWWSGCVTGCESSIATETGGGRLALPVSEPGQDLQSGGPSLCGILRVSISYEVITRRAIGMSVPPWENICCIHFEPSEWWPVYIVEHWSQGWNINAHIFPHYVSLECISEPYIQKNVTFMCSHECSNYFLLASK